MRILVITSARATELERLLKSGPRRTQADRRRLWSIPRHAHQVCKVPATAPKSRHQVLDIEEITRATCYDYGVSGSVSLPPVPDVYGS
jgi:hypothetical protein